MRRRVFLALVWSVLLPSPAAASGLTFIPPGSQPNATGSPYTHTWQIGGLERLLPAGQRITAATLFFDDYEGSDPSPRNLFVQLLDTSNTIRRTIGHGSGQTLIRQTIYEAVDTSPSPLDSRYAFDARSRPHQRWVADPLTDLGYLRTRPSSTYAYDLSSAEVADLMAYISSGGDMAFALDGAANFFADGVRLLFETSTIASVPEPATLTLFGVGLLSGLYLRRRLRGRARLPG